jgi:hypothetical protein
VRREGGCGRRGRAVGGEGRAVRRGAGNKKREGQWEDFLREKGQRENDQGGGGWRM